MTDCDAVRRQYPNLELRCCTICHRRKCFSPARLDNRWMRLCCCMLGYLRRAEIDALNFEGVDERDLDQLLQMVE